jgi:hypothetical protein
MYKKDALFRGWGLFIHCLYALYINIDTYISDKFIDYRQKQLDI